MNKLVAFIWLIIYTCVSTGFVVSTHYCMDKQRSVELGATKQELCDKCGMHKEANDGCCRDEITVVKLQQDTQLAKIVTPSFFLLLSVNVVTQHLLTPFYNFTQRTLLPAFEPPQLQQENLYIENRVFRI